MSCDLDKVTAATESVAFCKGIIESLGKTTQKGGTYTDDNSGCTYHPDQQGWHQVMAKGGKPPTCSEVNPDQKRRRVCACKSYFLANGGQSCDDSCAAIGMSCDLDKVTAATESVAFCKGIIESLGKTTQKGGTYTDDNSGCTYHPDQQGWHQVMAKGGKPPTCSEVNPDQKRRRVCACKP